MSMDDPCVGVQGDIVPQDQRTTTMQGIEPMLLGVLSDGMMQEALNKLIAGLIGGAIAWGLRKWYYERKAKESKLNRVHRALFGVDDVDTIEGVVEIIEAHEEDIDELYTKVEEGKKKRKEIERKIERIKQQIRERHSDDGRE